MFYGWRIGVVHESTLLQATLSALFRTSTALLVAYLAARTYLVTGSRAVLALGCGALAFGFASVFASLLMTKPNVFVTVHNLGLCLAGGCFLLSAGWVVGWKQTTSQAPGLPTVALAYPAVVAALGLAVWGALAGVIPPFSTEQGFSPLRQAVLGLAVLEFALASLCFLILYGRSRTPFFKWYAIGLGLIGLGLLVIIAERSPGTLLSWTGRAGQYLGGLYMLIGIMTVAQGPWSWQIPLEQALYESEDKFAKAFRGNAAAMAMARLRDGCIIDVNETWTMIFGFGREEAIGRTAAELGLFKHPAERVRAIRDIETRGALRNQEFECVRKNGEEWTALMSSELITLQGEPVILVSSLDITERKRAEVERERLLSAERRAREEAEAALCLRDEFLYVAAHELKTPITSLRGYPQLLLRRIDRGVITEARQARPLLQVMDREAARLSQLVSQLLDLSHLEGKGLLLDRRVTDLVALTRKAVESLQAAASQPELKLQAPPCLMGSVDPERIQQVLINLIDNAVKFSPEGSPVEIELSTSDHSVARLTVRDYGPGIPPSERERLFSRYHRAGTRRPAGGLGLGLYLSKQIVELHGGHIEAEFPADGGTRFVVTLPYNPDGAS